MENCIVNGNINNDFFSQSYSQGIKRITGTKDSILNFQIPKELLEIRKKTWDNLLDKYSKKIFDDIELNVDTLEPEEEEEEKVVSEEEFNCGQRIPIRKPATFIQYWINTGNLPYKTLLDENELSEIGLSLSEKEITSLSEKEITSLLTSPITNAVNATNTDKQKCKNDSSCSSVDTAAYILSNANITKKADAVAIIKGAKYIEGKSLKDVAIKDIEVPSNNKIKCMETTRIDREITSSDNVNVDVLDTELYPMSTKYVITKVCNKVAASTLPSNAIQSNMYSQSLSCKDKIDESNTSQRNLDVQTIDNIASVFRQFDKTSKQLIANDENDMSGLDRDKVLKMDFYEKQVLGNVTHKTIVKNTSLTTFHRKKLYTGRDSPTDLILTETLGTNRLSRANQSLHPALDFDGTIKGESFLIHKGKNKLFTKRNLDFNKIKGKEEMELDYISNEIITDISNEYTNDNKIQDTTIDSSFKNLSDLHDNSNKQDDILFQEYNDTNISVRNEDFSKQNLASLNLKPVVLLERIKSFNQCELGENTHIVQKENIRNRHLNKSKKLHSCKIENLELETIGSDESNVFVCQCNINASQRVSSLSDCSLDLRLNIEDFTSNAEKKDDKVISNLKNTNVNQNKELHVERMLQLSKKYYTNATMESQVSNKKNVLSNKSKSYSYLYGINEMDNMKLPEIKIVLERLPLSVTNCINTMTEMQVLNKNNAIWQKEILNKSETHFSNLYGTNEKDNVKLREIRIVLERLPANMCLKEDSNVTNTNIYSNKKKILQNTGLQTNYKREPEIRKISKILACKNETTVQPVRNNYSSTMNTKFKKNNDKINDTYDIVIQSESQVFDKIESAFTFQHKTFRHKNCSKASQDIRSKRSILTFTSSDEDDFVRSILHPRKKSKVSTDNDILSKSNTAEKNWYDQTKLIISSDKDKYCSRNLSTIRSSKKTVQRNIGSIKEKKEHSGSTQTDLLATSLEIHRNEEFMFSSSEDENNSVFDNSNKIKKIISSFDSKGNTNNNSLKHSNGAINKNGIDCEDNTHVILFQTKTFYTNSSDSDESNSYTLSTCKVLKSSSTRNRLRYHNRVNSEEINSDIKSKINDTRKDVSFSSLKNNIRVTSVQKTSNSLEILEETNLSKIKEISEKYTNSVAIQQDDITSTVSELLTFQTKTYYDSSDSSDSSEIM